MIGFLFSILLVAPFSVFVAWRVSRASYSVSSFLSGARQVTSITDRDLKRERRTKDARAHERESRVETHVRTRMCALLPCDSSRYIAPGTCPVQARVGTFDERSCPIFSNFLIETRYDLDLSDSYDNSFSFKVNRDLELISMLHPVFGRRRNLRNNLLQIICDHPTHDLNCFIPSTWLPKLSKSWLLISDDYYHRSGKGNVLEAVRMQSRFL